MEKKKLTLAEIDKNIPFTVPENYFSQFNESIMDNLPLRVEESKEKISLWEKSKTWVYMAAMFLGLFFTIKVLTTSTNSPADKVAAVSDPYEVYKWQDVQITRDDFFNFIETQYEDESYYELMYDEVYLNSL